MTNDELQAIRERCGKAAPGPWEWKDIRPGSSEKEGWQGAESLCQSKDLKNDYLLLATEYPDEPVPYIDGSPEDMAFIAHARTDVPALLAEIDRLQVTLALAREHGAAEMRERAAKIVDRQPGESSYQWEYNDMRPELAKAIRALPLTTPGEP